MSTWVPGSAPRWSDSCRIRRTGARHHQPPAREVRRDVHLEVIGFARIEHARDVHRQGLDHRQRTLPGVGAVELRPDRKRVRGRRRGGLDPEGIRGSRHQLRPLQGQGANPGRKARDEIVLVGRAEIPARRYRWENPAAVLVIRSERFVAAAGISTEKSVPSPG